MVRKISKAFSRPLYWNSKLVMPYGAVMKSVKPFIKFWVISQSNTPEQAASMIASAKFENFAIKAISASYVSLISLRNVSFSKNCS